MKKVEINSEMALALSTKAEAGSGNAISISGLKKVVFLCFRFIYVAIGTSYAQLNLSTGYLKIHINNRGWITRMKNIAFKPSREFSPVDKPSSLLCPYNSLKNQYYYPEKAVYNPVSRKMTLRVQLRAFLLSPNMENILN